MDTTNSTVRISESNESNHLIPSPSLVEHSKDNEQSSKPDNLVDNNSVDNKCTRNAAKETPSNFVFGSNISSRVVNNASAGASSNLWSRISSDDQSTTSVFTTLAKAVNVQTANVNGDKKLVDSANEVSEVKRKSALHLEKVDVVTGEEEDTLIASQCCRGFVFDVDKQTWNNLGTVSFHLSTCSSDDEVEHCRVVVRLLSTQRLIINTLVWADMPVALMNPQRLRIGVICEDGARIKSYLFVFSSVASASQVHDFLVKHKLTLQPANSDKTGLSSGQKHQLSNDIDRQERNSSFLPKMCRGSNVFTQSLNHPIFQSDCPQSSSRVRKSFLDTVVNKMHDANNAIVNNNTFVASINANDVLHSKEESEKGVDSSNTNKSVELSDTFLKLCTTLVTCDINCSNLLSYPILHKPKMSDCLLVDDRQVKIKVECQVYSFSKGLQKWVNLNVASVAVIGSQSKVAVSTDDKVDLLNYLSIECANKDVSHRFMQISIWSGLNIYKTKNSICLITPIPSELIKPYLMDPFNDGSFDMCALILETTSPDVACNILSALY